MENNEKKPVDEKEELSVDDLEKASGGQVISVGVDRRPKPGPFNPLPQNPLKDRQIKG